MLVAELAGHRRFKLVERELPDPAPGEVQVRIAAVGICGSDIHSYAEGAVGDTPCSYPMVLGHEPAGVVVKTGPGVTGIAPGDRAALEPGLYCYHCEYCMSGRHNICAHLRFMSSPEDPGFFRDSCNVPARNLIPIPKELSLQEAALIEPLAVVLHSLEFARPAPGETAVVFGAGPIGLLTVAALKLAGVSRVWSVEPLAHRRALALAMGADAAMDPRSVDAALEIQAETGKRGVDMAIDCATKENTINQCIGALRNAGRLVVTGIPSEIQVSLDFHPMRRKEIALFNVRRSNNEADLARELLRAHSRLFAPLITHERPLEGISGAFEMVESYADGIGKVVLVNRMESVHG